MKLVNFQENINEAKYLQPRTSCGTCAACGGDDGGANASKHAHGQRPPHAHPRHAPAPHSHARHARVPQ